MSIKPTAWRLAIGAAFLSGGMASAPVLAQDEAEEASQLERFEVTGSRIKRVDFETAQPVDIITRAQIDRTGLTSIGEVLEQLPSAGTGGLNTAVNNGGNGSELIDLRYLGTRRVLVLVNGRRWVNQLSAFGGTTGVDLSTIPAAFVERVEILKDGASAVYGTDAIAGVINIILKTDHQGVSVASQYGAYTEGDGETIQSSLTMGKTLDKSNSVMFGIQHTRQADVFAGDRDISNEPGPGTGVLFFGSSRIPEGRFQFTPPDGNPPNGCTATSCTANANGRYTILPDGSGGYRDFTNADRYDFAPINYLLTPSERTSIFATLNTRLTTDIDMSTSLYYNLRESDQLLAEVPLDIGNTAGGVQPIANATYISEDNPFNPFGYNVGLAGAGNAPGTVSRRMNEVGQRQTFQDVDTFRVMSEFTGYADIFLPIDWRAGASVSQSAQRETTRNLLNVERVRTALGPVDICNATPGCVPLNLFGEGSITPEMADYIRYTGTGKVETRMRNVFADISTTLGNVSAGPIGFAAGLEIRRESFEDVPDPLVISGASSTNAAQPTRGSLETNEIFAELNLPLLADVPFVQSLEANLAARYSDYDRFSAETSAKASLRYQPFDDLIFRTTVSQAFRAPSVGELFLGLSDSFDTITDPCSDYTNSTNTNTQANCAADGIPATYEQSNSQLRVPRGGNPDLKPETADTVTAGIVYSPTMLPDVDFYLDWYRYELTDAITVLGAEDILERCYEIANRDNSSCALVERNATGNIVKITDAFLNIGGIEIEGFDFGANYDVSTDFGRFDFGANFTYLTELREITEDSAGNRIETLTQGQGADLVLGLTSGAPRVKGNLITAWSQGPLGASWTVRYIKSQKATCFVPVAAGVPESCSGADASNIAGLVHDTGDVIYHDLQVTARLPGTGFGFAVGLNNAFDQDPPAAHNTSSPGYDSILYDVPGPFYYGRVTYDFGG